MGGVLGLIVLDQTVVGVALPTLRDELHMSQVAAHWIVNGYLLMLTCMEVAGGRLGDLWGHRRPFIGGLALFSLASLVGGFAQDSTWLITARLVQGVGAAMIFPATAAMITAVFEPPQRGMALGGINMTAQFLGGTAGMAVGGSLLIMTHDFQIVFATAAVLSLVILIIAYPMGAREGGALEPVRRRSI